MNRHILVTYSTRAGSTAQVANVISEVLVSRSFMVDIKPVKEKPSIRGYGAIVLGSAIRLGAWLPEMIEFIWENKSRLNQIPTAIFTVHMLNKGDDADSRAAREAYTSAIHEMISPLHEIFFAGKIDFSTLSFLDNLNARVVQPKLTAHSGDFRDWDKIRYWAQTIFSQEIYK
jgi:menaquinone-dependent protoporphyrinogen oxidase